MSLINREDALKEVHDRFDSARFWYKTAKDEETKIRAEAAIASFTECSLMLKNLPSAEKTGEWIELTYYDFKCSICGNTMMDKWNYCPNCGARMGDNDEL